MEFIDNGRILCDLTKTEVVVEEKLPLLRLLSIDPGTANLAMVYSESQTDVVKLNDNIDIDIDNDEEEENTWCNTQFFALKWAWHVNINDIAKPNNIASGECPYSFAAENEDKNIALVKNVVTMDNNFLDVVNALENMKRVLDAEPYFQKILNSTLPLVVQPENQEGCKELHYAIRGMRVNLCLGYLCSYIKLKAKGPVYFKFMAKPNKFGLTAVKRIVKTLPEDVTRSFNQLKSSKLQGKKLSCIITEYFILEKRLCTKKVENQIKSLSFTKKNHIADAILQALYVTCKTVKTIMITNSTKKQQQQQHRQRKKNLTGCDLLVDRLLTKNKRFLKFLTSSLQAKRVTKTCRTTKKRQRCKKKDKQQSGSQTSICDYVTSGSK